MVDLLNSSATAPPWVPEVRPSALGGVVLREIIGEGATARIYLGHHTRFNIPVAVKVLKEASPTNINMFLDEARLTVSIDHPNLVRVFDINVDQTSGSVYMVMEYVKGCSAYELLWRSMRNQHRPLSQVSAVEIVLSSAWATGAAHEQGIIHRDLKPENILVRASDGMVKVTDLGFGTNFLTKSGLGAGQRTEIVGTPGFFSPEVLALKPATPASDVYALGVVLFELVTGHLPFGKSDDDYATRQSCHEPEDPCKYVPSLDPEIRAVLMRALSRDPLLRQADGNRFAEALKPILQRLCGQGESATILRGSDMVRVPVVMCVDDDPGVLNLIRDVLAQRKMHAVCFNDPQAALEQVSAVNPDVAVLDMRMPGMNGVELCRRLRQVAGCGDLGVLILSGDTEDSTIKQALGQGVTDYLVKPLDIKELVVRVQLLTRLRNMSRERSDIEVELSKIRRFADATA